MFAVEKHLQTQRAPLNASVSERVQRNQRRHIKLNVFIRDALVGAPACCPIGKGFLLPPSTSPAQVLAHTCLSLGEQTTLVCLKGPIWRIWRPQQAAKSLLDPIFCVDARFAVGVRGVGEILPPFATITGGTFFLITSLVVPPSSIFYLLYHIWKKTLTKQGRNLDRCLKSHPSETSHHAPNQVWNNLPSIAIEMDIDSSSSISTVFININRVICGRENKQLRGCGYYFNA